ncbi:MAG: hypothetical protein JNL82_29845 [Myxococcales bacterium]|nr:hypothetical protein [Myxococcales bacterium]
MRIRDQLRQERAAGCRPRLGMRSYADGAIDAYARAEADRRAQAAIIRHNEAIEQGRRA